MSGWQDDDRRKQDRRRYNRRQAEGPGAPPYFAVFERIAIALETIAHATGVQQLVLPSDDDEDER